MKKELLILILQNLVLFPNQKVKLELDNGFSRNIIELAINNFEKEILIVRIYSIIHSSMVLVSVENFTPALTTLRPSVRYGLA